MIQDALDNAKIISNSNMLEKKYGIQIDLGLNIEKCISNELKNSRNKLEELQAIYPFNYADEYAKKKNVKLTDVIREEAKMELSNKIVRQKEIIKLLEEISSVLKSEEEKKQKTPIHSFRQYDL